MDVNKELRLQEWANDLKEARESGLGQKTWCKLHNIKYSTFRYRVKVINDELKKRQSMAAKEAALPAVQFAEVPAELMNMDSVDSHTTCSSEIKLETAHAKLSIPSNIPQEQLRTILEVALNV